MSLSEFFTHLNAPIRGILRTPILHWILSPAILLVTVTGRRTGRRYTIPLGYLLEGNDVTVLVSEARKKQWWRNYREPRPLEVHLRGRARVGTAEVVGPESPEYRPRVEAALRRVPRLDRVFGIEYDRERGLSDDQVRALAGGIAVVRIALEP